VRAFASCAWSRSFSASIWRKPAFERPRIDERQDIAGFDVLTLLEIDLDELAVDLRLIDAVLKRDPRAGTGQIDRHIAARGLPR